MRTDEDYIRDAVEKIERLVKGMDYEEFLKDAKTQYTVVRALEIIGKAVKNISDELKKKYPEIPWKAMAGMRDKLIHAYFGVDWEIVWLTVKKDVPKIKRVFKNLLGEGGSDV